MNKLVKIILFVFNLIALGVAIFWLSEEKSPEAFIVMVSQISMLLTLLFESKISKIGISKVSDSEVGVETNSRDEGNILIKGIKKGSKVNVKKK